MIEEVHKSQAVRLWDVVFIGPALVYWAVKPDPLNRIERGVMASIGVATIIYNLRNYLATKENIRSQHG